MTARSIRVLIADDHSMVRQGLVVLLGMMEGIEVVAEAANGVEAIERYCEHTPDVTLMDLRMPEMGGVQAIERIRSFAPDARFIVLTTYDSDEDIYRALKAGARAYVLKGMSKEELVEIIRKVYAGRLHVPAAIAERMAERMHAPELTPREFDVLEEIVRGRANKQIAEALKVSEATVKTHINSLLAKLGVSDRTQAATTALQRGLVPLESLKRKERWG
jgi:DNA-binding NarL/FixJ family response regulator